MTILIKGIDMPREGASLFIEVNPTGHIICQYSDDIVHYGYKNRAVPVPTPHGRLIDADKLYKWIKAECNPYGKPRIGYEDGYKVLDIIEATSTVIEAEE